MNYFKGIIKCKACSTKLNKEVRYNRKLDHDISYHLCSRRKNYGDCDSPIIKEDDLLDVIVQHCKIKHKAWSIEKLKLFILKINVEENGNIKILWRNGDVSVISDRELIF